MERQTPPLPASSVRTPTAASINYLNPSIAGNSIYSHTRTSLDDRPINRESNFGVFMSIGRCEEARTWIELTWCRHRTAGRLYCSMWNEFHQMDEPLTCCGDVEHRCCTGMSRFSWNKRQGILFTCFYRIRLPFSFGNAHTCCILKSMGHSNLLYANRRTSYQQPASVFYARSPPFDFSLLPAGETPNDDDSAVCFTR